MRLLALSFCFLIFTSTANSAPLSKWDAKMYRVSFQVNCKEEARKTSNGSKTQQANWCTCVGWESSKLLSKEDLQPENATTMYQKLNIAVEICKKQLLTPSGTFK